MAILNARDLKDADMQANQEMQSILDEFEAEYNLPQLKTLAGMVAKLYPKYAPEITQALAERDPEALKKLMDKFGG